MEGQWGEIKGEMGEWEEYYGWLGTSFSSRANLFFSFGVWGAELGPSSLF